MGNDGVLSLLVNCFPRWTVLPEDGFFILFTENVEVFVPITNSLTTIDPLLNDVVCSENPVTGLL